MIPKANHNIISKRKTVKAFARMLKYKCEPEQEKIMFIVVNETALEMNGLCCAGLGPLRILGSTDLPETIQGRRVIATRSRLPEDTTHYVRESLKYTGIVIPSAERAIVESILNIDDVDEGFILESLYNYFQGAYNTDELYEVADFFSVSRDALEYWIQESQSYESD